MRDDKDEDVKLLTGALIVGLILGIVIGINLLGPARLPRKHNIGVCRSVTDQQEAGALSWYWSPDRDCWLPGAKP